MKEVSIKAKLELKHKLESEWNISDYVPIQSEPIIYDIEVDSNGNTLELPEGRTTPYTYERIKIGDGIHLAKDLPFSIQKGDWNQFDETAPDYIKNRTHGKQVEIFTGDISINEDYSKEYIYIGTNFGNKYDFESDLVRVFDGEYDIDKFTCNGIIYDGTEESTYSQHTKKYKVFYNVKSVPSYDGEALCNGIAILANEPVSINLNSSISNPASMIDFDLNIEIPSKGLWITRFATVKDVTLVEYVYKQLEEKYIPDSIARTQHEHEFKDIVDSAYDNSSKWEEITDLLNQHAYGDLIIVTQAVCPGNGGPGYRVCARCGRKRVELVTQQHVASSGWYVNNTSHTAWQKCAVCGGIMNMHSHLKDGQISYNCELERCPYSTEPI